MKVTKLSKNRKNTNLPRPLTLERLMYTDSLHEIICWNFSEINTLKYSKLINMSDFGLKKREKRLY